MKRIVYELIISFVRKAEIVIMFVFLTFSLDAHNLRKLSSKDGLSNSAILSICQDSERLMWFGSVDGLNVYDGVDINIFKPNINATVSLSGNLIEEVWEGEEGVIWINTNHGLNRYNKKTREIEFHDTFEGKYYLAKTLNNETFAIRENNTIDYYNRQNKQFVSIPYPGIVKDDIQRIFIDETNILWIITNKGQILNALIAFDTGFPVITQINDFMHDSAIRYAFMEEDRIYFIDKDYYLFEMNAISRKKNLVLNLEKELNERGIVSSIIKDNDDYLIAFQTNGLIGVFNTPENLVKYHVRDIGIYCGVFCLYKDKVQDILWVGTDGQGIYMYTRDMFSIHSTTFDLLQNAIQKPVRTLIWDKEQTLWVGTKDDGILLVENFNPDKEINNKKIHHITTLNSTLVNNSVYAFGESEKNILWIGGDGPGLNYYSYRDKKIKKVRALDKEPILFVHSIKEVNDSTLWLASVGKGIYKVILSDSNDDPVIKSINRFTFDDDEMSSNYFFTVCQENDSILWFGNRGNGLRRLNIRTETFDKVLLHKDNIRIINDILSIYKDSKNNLWAGTSFGILKILEYNAYTKEVSFLNYNEIEGLPNNTIHGILEDDMGYLWVSTNGGIVRFDTEKEKFQVYNHKNGLDVFEFSDGAYMKDTRTGSLFFGGINGFVTISKDIYAQAEFVPKIFFSGLKIYENDYNINDFIHQRDGEDYIQFTYDQNFFSISFIASDYINGQNIKYFYNLENFNSKWIDNGYSNVVNFTNISPGEYTLHVRCDNGNLTTKAYSLKVVILPPWYMTIWAYTVYLILFLAFLFLLIQLTRRRYRRKREDIIEKMNQQQKEEIYESKLRFFTNITHEFSTPLTLIYGPCERILSYVKSDIFIKKYAGTIMKNAERLNSLIQELIEFRRIETGHKACVIEQLDVTELSIDIADSFKELSETRNIQYQSTIETGMFWNSDRGCFIKIVANLLSNAFKYTPDNGTISLRIHIKHGLLDISVSNTGKGIKDKDLPYVFDRYRVLENLEKQTQKGFFSRNGLGLAICHNMVKLLDGDIDVISIPDKYTEFKVLLPLKDLTEKPEQIDTKEHFLNQIDPLMDKNTVPIETLALERSRLTIFVVDDDPEMGGFISEILNKQYNVVSIEDPLSVSAMLELVQPQLIISDIMMPELDGISLMKQIKANRRTAHIPFILLSAKNTLEEQTEGITVGAEAYIVKPFNVKYLLSVVDRLLQRQNDLKDYYRSAISAYEFANGKFIHKENKEFFEKMVEIIDRNLTNPDFSTEGLATELGLSPRHLYRKLKDITEQTPANLIKEYRLLYVEKLLLTTKYSVDESMYKAGFNNRGSFYRLFAQKFGVTPKSYREMKTENEMA